MRGERRFSVLLHERRVGTLRVREDHTIFRLAHDYVSDPHRAILGLRFEEDPQASLRANMRLPPWFSNLLPEGRLREMIARQRGVSPEREMELLAEVGQDLPGAVKVLPSDGELPDSDPPPRKLVAQTSAATTAGWRFSLAGVQLKFSMLKRRDHFVAPARGRGGEWIVKLPDATFSHVPQNEMAMMTLAGRCGIRVPETRLVHRDEIEDVPDRLWPSNEVYAYAVRRFDRDPAHGRIHMEDFAQVRGFYPDKKYEGNSETLAKLIYRGSDVDSLLEFVRRLTFHILIRNGDAHLKNWSLLYLDRRRPALSPAYDLVSTWPYEGPDDHSLGLKLQGRQRYEAFRLSTFQGLQRALGLCTKNVSFAEEAATVAEKVKREWPSVRDSLLTGSRLATELTEILEASLRLMGAKA